MSNDPTPAGEPTGSTPDPQQQPAQQAETPPPATAAEAIASEALRAAEQAAANLRAETGAGAETGESAEAGAKPLTMPDFTPAAKGAGGAAAASGEGIDLLADVNLNVKIELGRTRMLVEDVLRLGEGSVVELDKLAGDPVDIYVNDRPVARGEVLVLNDNFCVRINEILGAGEEFGTRH
mgnify:CR=1 FL=1|jgi:flagellar motor switch protein FliN/FliY